MILCTKFSEKGEKSFENRENADCGDVKTNFLYGTGLAYYISRRGVL
jgi:hypothetical protein